MLEKPNYYAILIAEVRYSNKISSTSKLIYAEITALSNKHGYCWASNKYLAGLYNITEKSVSLSIKELATNGFIETKIDKEDGNKRYIYLHTYEKKGYDPYGKKCVDPYINNTSINNKYIKENDSPYVESPLKEKHFVKEDNPQFLLSISKQPISDDVASEQANAGLVVRMAKKYVELTGEPYKSSREDFIIMARLLKKFGENEVLKKASYLLKHCESREYPCEKGYIDFTVKKLSSRWNELGKGKLSKKEQIIENILKKEREGKYDRQ